jgi:uncharacterized protein (DUF433 family)
VGGTSLAVRHVLRLYRDLGKSAEAIAEEYGLSNAQVHDALSYALDHPDEIAYYAEENQIRTVMRNQDLVLVGDRLIPRLRLQSVAVPEGTPVHTWDTLPEDKAK